VFVLVTGSPSTRQERCGRYLTRVPNAKLISAFVLTDIRYHSAFPGHVAEKPNRASDPSLARSRFWEVAINPRGAGLDCTQPRSSWPRP